MWQCVVDSDARGSRFGTHADQFCNIFKTSIFL